MSDKYGEMKDDFLEEAMRLVAAAEENDVPLRIMGCLAFRIKALD